MAESKEELKSLLMKEESEKARGFQKSIYFCFIDMIKPFTVWITTKDGKFLKEMRIPDHLTSHL